MKSNGTVAISVFTGAKNRIAEIFGKSGRVLGQRVCFAQGETAKDIRTRLKGQGLKGNALTKAVNEVLAGEKDVRWVEFDACVSAMRGKGYIPDEMVAKATSGWAKFVKPREIVSKETKDKAALEAKAKELEADKAKLIATMKSIGLTEAEIAAALA
ncbi:MAG: hypothetical protein AB1813_16390 [Verrucomicrobiota bacterium]